MTFFDPRNTERLTPQQKAQYQEFLKQYPHLQTKMDTSRQLNTPLAQAVKQGEEKGQPLPSNADEDSLDLAAIEQEQKADVATKKTKPIAEMHIDPNRASMLSLDQEEKEKEQRAQERMRRQKAEEAQERAEEDQEEEVVAAPAPKKKTPKFSPTGKRHPILQKMRHSLGMEELEDPVSISIQGVEYTFKRLMREDIAKAISATTFHTSDEANIRSYMEAAIVAYAVKTIDGVSLADVFEVPLQEIRLTTGKEEPLSSKERQDKGSQFFFNFLVDGPTELTDTLIVFYEQNFPPINLIGGDSSLALCPVANCTHKAIVDAEHVRYCPFHGKELRKEETLPNPS